jgi:hypothetical protein
MNCQADSALDNVGIELVSDVLSAAECEKILTDVGAMLSDSAGSRRLLQLDCCRHMAQMLRTHPRIMNCLPPDPVAVQCTLFDKSSSKNWLVPLHQDLAIPVRERVDASQCSGWSEKEGVVFVQPPVDVLADLVAVRLHLDDSTEDNGPLKIVAGSHRHGRLSIDEAAKLRDRHREQICTANRGDALLMRPLLLHASSKARSDAPRRVLHFLYGPRLLPFGLSWRESI